MRITADTNVLLRLVLADDEAQGLAAVEAMEDAGVVAISIVSLCELSWMLGGRSAMSRPEIATAIRGLVGTSNVVVDRPAVEAGLRVLEAGGDFADGVIAFDGQWRGGDTFVSFDRKAVTLLEDQGVAVRLLS